MRHVKILASALICMLGMGASGCLGAGKWVSPSSERTARPGEPTLELDAQSIRGDSALDTSGRPIPKLASYRSDSLLPSIPEIPVRKKARFCCAFGTSLGVKIGELPVPWVKIGRILSLSELGPHRYDGATAAIDDKRKGAFPKGEHNGLMYTCRGGFIDTAHVRETVDWAAYFVAKLDRHLEHGAVFELGDEGGDRRMIVEPVLTELFDQQERSELIVSLAQWMAHYVMAWHEIAQWYGWSILPLYPEVVSGFSPEDMYSNAVGLRLLDRLDVGQSLVSEKTYNEHIDRAMDEELLDLQPVSKDVGLQAVQAVDKLWWDSDERLPDKHLVQRRYIDIDTELEPWLLPEALISEDLRASLEKQCGETANPLTIRIPDSAANVVFDDFVTFQIDPEKRVLKAPIFDVVGSRITQHDFPRLMEDIRRQNRAEFGQRADLPD
jgi:hypothetical protein